MKMAHRKDKATKPKKNIKPVTLVVQDSTTISKTIIGGK